MKCLDTPLLEDLLLGRKRARAWMEGLSGGAELATTEVNLYELALGARRARGRRAFLARLRALEEVRKVLTVLPLDAEASRKAGELLTGPQGASEGLGTLVAAICLVHGVDEIHTSQRRKFPSGLGALRVVRV